MRRAAAFLPGQVPLEKSHRYTANASVCVCCPCNIRACVCVRVYYLFLFLPCGYLGPHRTERPSRFVFFSLGFICFPIQQPTHCWTLGRNLREEKKKKTTKWKEGGIGEERMRRKRRSCGEHTHGGGRWEDGEAGGNSLKRKKKCTRNATNIGPLTARIKRVRLRVATLHRDSTGASIHLSLFSPSSPFLLLLQLFFQCPSPLGVFAPDK